MTESVSKAPPDSLFELATDQWTEPYWQAAREHRLVWPTCTACGAEREMGAPFCHHCLSQKIAWKPLSGRGTLYSYTVVRFPLIEAMNDCVPYVPAGNRAGRGGRPPADLEPWSARRSTACAWARRST